MTVYYPLAGINNIRESTLTTDIQDTLVEYFDWALLEKGNYFNVNRNQIGPNGVDMSQLRFVSDPNFPSGCVWEGFRGNWVWQSGLAGIQGSPPPIVGSDNTNPGISGVYVNNTFYPITTSGANAFYVDYYNGRVIFNTPLPSGAKVQAEFSYKWINVIYANDVPWLREVQFKTDQPDATTASIDKGIWNLPNEMKVALPAIAIEVVPRRSFKGYQLGGGQWVYTDVLFHCFAEDSNTRDKLVDITSFQNDRLLVLLDNNKIDVSGAFPIDYRGVPVSGALRFPDLLAANAGGPMTLKSTTLQKTSLLGRLFGAVVRTTTECIRNNI